MNDFTQSLIYILRVYSMLFLTNNLDNYWFDFILKTICYPMKGEIYNAVKIIGKNIKMKIQNIFFFLGMNKKLI